MTIANVHAKNGNNDDEKEDIVNHPKHYTSGKYEVIKVIECLEEDFEKTGITVSVKTVYDILTANKEKKSVTNVKIPVFSETSVAD